MRRRLCSSLSDNGPHHEGGHDHNFFDSNGPLKGFKRSMHDGGIRVPMLVRWPGKIQPGSVSDHPSAFWDYLPTACELAGADSPPSFSPGASEASATTDGISYLPTLLGRPQDQSKHEYLYWASLEGETSVGVRAGKWKLVQYRGKKQASAAAAAEKPSPGNWRLYDLTVDVGEENDLADDNPQRVTQILEMLKRDGLLRQHIIPATRRGNRKCSRDPPRICRCVFLRPVTFPNA